MVVKELPPLQSDRFRLPNSVSLLGNNALVVADGGSDGIFMLSLSGKLLRSVAGSGFSRYSFRQPVAVAVSPLHEIFVADWHNHRVVIFDDELKYKGEFGRFGAPNGLVSNWAGSLRDLTTRIRTCLSNNQYISTHFGDSPSVFRREERLTDKLTRLSYAFTRRSLSAKLNLNKPNGIAFLNDVLYISQKNAKCISMLRRREDGYFDFIKTQQYGTEGCGLGRLGNLCTDKDLVYACDEYEHCIWVFNGSLAPTGKLDCGSCDAGTFLPFSCCLVRKDLMAVCGGMKFRLIDLQHGEVSYSSREIGELHGIAFDSGESVLYLTNRSSAVINRFSLT